jgi:AcrR family transcriptional regulator
LLKSRHKRISKIPEQRDLRTRITSAQIEKTDGNIVKQASGVGATSREDILVAASQAFMERGFSATSLDDVANRLGSTKGRIYHHFRSKADLFIHLQQWAIEHLIDRVGPIASREDLDPKAKIHAMAYEHIVLIATGYGFESAAVLGREAALLNISTTLQHKALRKVIEARDQYEDLFAMVIEQGIASGAFEDVPARLIAKPMLGALNWLLVWYKPGSRNSLSTVEQLAQLHAAFVVRSVLRENSAGRSR